MDPLSLAVGAVILAVGMLIGRRMRRKPPKPPAIKCGCGHNYGAHENGGRCMAGVKTANEWSLDKYGDREASHWHYPQCPCRAYDGPEPLPRSWTPELPLGTGEIES